MRPHTSSCVCATSSAGATCSSWPVGEALLGDELGIYLDELAELARYSGLQTLIRCGQSGPMEIRSASLCYDFAFETISLALKAEASPLDGLA